MNKETKANLDYLIGARNRITRQLSHLRNSITANRDDTVKKSLLNSLADELDKLRKLLGIADKPKAGHKTNLIGRKAKRGHVIPFGPGKRGLGTQRHYWLRADPGKTTMTMVYMDGEEESSHIEIDDPCFQEFTEDGVWASPTEKDIARERSKANKENKTQ